MSEKTLEIHRRRVHIVKPRPLVNHSTAKRKICQTVSTSNKSKSFKCTECNYVIAQEDELKRHKRDIHQMKTGSLSPLVKQIKADQHHQSDTDVQDMEVEHVSDTNNVVNSLVNDLKQANDNICHLLSLCKQNVDDIIILKTKLQH